MFIVNALLLRRGHRSMQRGLGMRAKKANYPNLSMEGQINMDKIG